MSHPHHRHHLHCHSASEVSRSLVTLNPATVTYLAGGKLLLHQQRGLGSPEEMLWIEKY